MSTFGNHCPCCYDRVALHHTAIQDNRSHTDKYIILEGTAMYDSVVSYGNIVTNSGRGLLVGTMYHHVVLYINFVADNNSIHIAPKDGIVPYTTILTEGNLANKDSSLGYKYVLSYNGGFSPNFSDDRHKIVVFKCWFIENQNLFYLSQIWS